MVGEDLHGRFGVRVVRRLEAQLLDAQLLEELADDAEQVAERQISVGDETFDL